MDVHAEPPVSADQQSPRLPQIPGGRYHIVERLSAGAIGAVYQALDTVLDRAVAVKCVHLNTPFADHGPDELRERFVREARIAARLQHPNIVTIHDIVATDERGFIIMEFIAGESFESFLRRRGRLDLPDAVRVISQLASALDYAHGRNVVHRDVKPANILISPSLWVWITDFGIAKSELSTNLTMAGGVLGAPDYMSPEQAKGEDVDARSDLFSLGCILFECVTGEKPFRSPSLTGVLMSIINDEPVFPLNWKSLGLPNGLRAILHHALEKDRKNRYPAGANLVKALEALTGRLEAAAPAPPRDSTVLPTIAEPAPQAASTEAGGHVESRETPPAHEAAEAAERAESIGSAPEPPAPQETVDPEPPPSPSAEASNENESHPPDEQDEQRAEAVESPEQTVVLSTAPEAAPEEPPPPAPVVDAERMKALKDDSRPLRLSASLSGELQRAVISPEEGFLLSRIDGQSRASDILAMSPMPEAETGAALLNLLDKELIQFGGSSPKPASAPARPKGVPDEETLRELDRLLELAKAEEYAELLGIPPDSPPAKRKSAYLKIIGKYHPDKFPRAADEIRNKLSRLCAEASEAVEAFEKAKEKSNSNHSSLAGGVPHSVAVSKARGPDDSFHSVERRRRLARELYDRALRAFDAQDFWEAIQLCRQALEVDETQADYFHLLGCALMQNKMWRREAADSFRKASELDPHNVTYLGMLGAIYKSEGLTTRANAVLKKAQLIDPAYTLPEIDGEVAVEAE